MQMQFSVVEKLCKALIVALFMLPRISAGTEIYTHAILEFPKTQSCDAVKDKLTQDFQTYSKAQVYSSAVTKDGKTACDIEISYVASERLKIASSVDRSMTGSIKKGTFATLAHCISGLKNEIEVFEKSTGLNAWVSYCRAESTLLNSYPFYALVEGFGAPRKNIFSTDSLLRATNGKMLESVLSDIKRNVAIYGGEFISLVARPHISEDEKELTLRYYGTEKFYLNFESVGSSVEPEHCFAQLDRIKNDLQKLKMPPLSLSCTRYWTKDHRLNIGVLSTEVIGLAHLATVLDPKPYGKLSDCEKSLPSTMQFYKTQLGKDAVSGVCGNAGGSFKATLIIQRPI